MASVVAARSGGNNVAVGMSSFVNAPDIGSKSEGEARESCETSQEAARGGGDRGRGTGTPSSHLFLCCVLLFFQNHLPLTKMLWFCFRCAKEKSADGDDDDKAWRR